MINIAIFNNKGGVGKTTYLYHIANLIADKQSTVLMVDCDSQCNLTSYTLNDTQIKKSWADEGNSIYRVIEPIATGIGDFRKRQPTKVYDNLYIVPGDIDLSIFEDRLGETWSSAANQEISLRAQIAIHRYVHFAAEKVNAKYIFFDLGPNLGALNRAVLGSCDYFITPLSPDLFSIKGTQNLGNKFVTWNEEWSLILNRWKNGKIVELPNGVPKFLGYVMQQHNVRSNKEGMTLGWKIFGNQIDKAVTDNIVNKLKPLGQVVERENYRLGAIPNLHSLIPYSLDAHKPVYKCTSRDGLRGDHINKAKESSAYYEGIIEMLLQL
ncbi:MAG: ParA family protein [Oscillospiraceae bacterium]|jgi:chromosome partitioning protein